MKVVCGWCKKDMGEKEPLENKNTSHGICDDCKKKMDKEIDEWKGGQDVKKESR